jgi:hypothetical protein
VGGSCDLLLIVCCVGPQPLLGLSPAAVKFLFADPNVASDARIKSYPCRELWCDAGPLVSALSEPLFLPTHTGRIQSCEWLLEGKLIPFCIDIYV